MAKKTSPVTIQDIRSFLNGIFKEREGVVDGMLVAMLSKQMLFMLGPPGTAKSDLCGTLCQTVGGNYFNWLISKYSTPEDIFGPISFKALENDNYCRVTNGKLPKADVAFLDEIFKGNSAILNTLLPIMNERIFHNGAQPENIPLQVMFGASNELPDGEELAPMFDRFVLRYVVPEIQSDLNMKALLMMQARGDIPLLGLEGLKAEQDKVAQVQIPEAIIDLLIQIRSEVKNLGLIVSDRKWIQIMKVLKAQAHLNGHAEVQSEDLEILENILWRDPEEVKKVRQLVAKYGNPLGEEILGIKDSIQEVLKDYKSKSIEAIEAQKKIKKGADKLRSFRKTGISNVKLDQAIAEVEGINNRFVREELGLT